MSSSPPQKLTFTSFKKDKPITPQFSPQPPEQGPTVVKCLRSKLAFKILLAFNLSLSAYIIFKKAHIDTIPDISVSHVAVDIDAAESDHDVFPPSFMQKLSFSHWNFKR